MIVRYIISFEVEGEYAVVSGILVYELWVGERFKFLQLYRSRMAFNFFQRQVSVWEQHVVSDFHDSPIYTDKWRAFADKLVLLDRVSADIYERAGNRASKLNKRAFHLQIDNYDLHVLVVFEFILIYIGL